jgi:hypothetical protein
MKKIKITLLILVMAMLFAACNTGETPTTTGGGDEPNNASAGTNDGTSSQNGEQRSAYEIYMLASEALENAESMIMESSTVMKMDMDGEEMEMVMDAVIEMVMRSETDIDMRMVATTKMDDMEMPSEMYFRNGVMYMDMLGMQMKMEMPLEQMLEQVNSTGALDFPEEAILDASMTAVDGGTKITFTLSGSVMSDMIDELTGGILATMGIDDMDMSVNMGDIIYVVVVDADYMLTTMDMTMFVSMEVDGETMSMDVVTSMEVIQIGGVEITFPDYLDDFMDMSGAMF